MLGVRWRIRRVPDESVGEDLPPPDRCLAGERNENDVEPLVGQRCADEPAVEGDECTSGKPRRELPAGVEEKVVRGPVAGECHERGLLVRASRADDRAVATILG